MRVGEKFCPGILHAVEAKDGLLLRIRVPGGLIAARQLRALSDLSTQYADGHIEITSRANIQLRAVRAENLPHLVNALESAGLFPSATHDRVRNLVISPMAGLDSSELIDARPLLKELDRRLIDDPRMMDLHPKFTFGIDGGGQRFSHDTEDIALQAISSEHFQLLIGNRDTGHCVVLEHAVDCLLQAASECIRLAHEFNVPVRGKRIIAIPGAMETITRQLAPSPALKQTVPSEAPIGIYPSKKPCLIPSVPLGRMTAQQALHVAEMAAEYSNDLRLAPWRGIVLGGIPSEAVALLTARLNAAGLSMDGRDGYRGLAACAGITGCDASLADVRADADALALRLRGADLIPGWTVHLSGCEKQCAMRHGATVDVVADSLGYNMKIDTLNGKLTMEHGSSASVIDAILSTHAAMSVEVRP